MATFRQHVQSKHDQNRQWFNELPTSRLFSGTGYGRRIDSDISCYQLLKLHDQIVAHQLMVELPGSDFVGRFNQLEEQLAYWEE